MARITAGWPATAFRRPRPGQPSVRRGAHCPPIKPQTKASRPGVATLGQMAALFAAAGLTLVKVPCNRCERRGRLSIARLLG